MDPGDGGGAGSLYRAGADPDRAATGGQGAAPAEHPPRGRGLDAGGGVSLVEAERRLLASALLDHGNERFVLLSEACIPVRNFTAVHTYLFT